MWNVDFVQFARLLDEINAVGLTDDQMKALATSMDLEPKDLKQIFNRATARWDELKPLLVKKTPLDEDQVSEELAENGSVEALVTIEFGEVVGQLEDSALEDVIDDISERASNVNLSNVDYKVVFADNDTLYLKVTAKVDESEEEDVDEENVEPSE
jgi:hypothetical protein